MLVKLLTHDRKVQFTRVACNPKAVLLTLALLLGLIYPHPSQAKALQCSNLLGFSGYNKNREDGAAFKKEIQRVINRRLFGLADRRRFFERQFLDTVILPERTTAQGTLEIAGTSIHLGKVALPPQLNPKTLEILLSLKSIEQVRSAKLIVRQDPYLQWLSANGMGAKKKIDPIEVLFSAITAQRPVRLTPFQSLVWVIKNLDPNISIEQMVTANSILKIAKFESAAQTMNIWDLPAESLHGAWDYAPNLAAAKKNLALLILNHPSNNIELVQSLSQIIEIAEVAFSESKFLVYIIEQQKPL